MDRAKIKAAVVQAAPVVFNTHRTLENWRILRAMRRYRAQILSSFPRRLSADIQRGWTLVRGSGVEAARARRLSPLLRKRRRFAGAGKRSDRQSCPE